MQEITPAELKKWMDEKRTFQLIDVREPYEAELCSMGGELIPMGDVIERLAEIRKDIPVVMHCRSGSRSAAVANALGIRYGFHNISSLQGGILAFGKAYDPTLKCD
ncbi:MAG: rhodanese-like domain-containing protein [Flavobacteriales bacterium]|nr:rhodanese-like domain-containing protein [Flavobacteriales bacterium]